MVFSCIDHIELDKLAQTSRQNMVTVVGDHNLAELLRVQPFTFARPR